MRPLTSSISTLTKTAFLDGTWHWLALKKSWMDKVWEIWRTLDICEKGQLSTQCWYFCLALFKPLYHFLYKFVRSKNLEHFVGEGFSHWSSLVCCLSLPSLAVWLISVIDSFLGTPNPPNAHILQLGQIEECEIISVVQNDVNDVF